MPSLPTSGSPESVTKVCRAPSVMTRVVDADAEVDPEIDAADATSAAVVSNNEVEPETDAPNPTPPVWLETVDAPETAREIWTRRRRETSSDATPSKRRSVD